MRRLTHRQGEEEVTEFQFVDDPRRGRPSDPIFQEFADTLRSRPGEWARYPNPVNSGPALACRINSHSGIKALRAPGFRATTKDGVVYVMFDPTENNKEKKA
jgi:hypothetical protein